MQSHSSGRWAPRVVAACVVACLALPARSVASPREENNAARGIHPRQIAARALASSDPDRALEACAPWTAPGPVPEGVDGDAAACRWIAAAAHAAAGEWGRVAWLLQPVVEGLGPAAPWARLLLAEALLASGDEAGARAQIQAARGVDPSGPLGEEASKLLARLDAEKTPEAAPAPADEPPIDQLSWPARLERLRRMLAVGEAREALAAIERVGTPPASHLTEVLWLQARAFSDAGEREQAEGALRILLTTEPTDERRRQARLLLGRLAARRDALEEAVGHLDEAAAGKSGGTASEAAFLAAFLFYDFGRYDEAAARFSSYLRAHRHRADEAAWFRGWSLYLRGKWEEAASELASLLRAHPRSRLVPQVIYWRARALEQAGRADEARALYRDGATRWPTDWYGQLSLRRLGPDAARPSLGLAPAPEASARPGGLRGQRLDRARALYDLGMVAQAGKELDAAIAGSKERGLLLAAARMALDGGDPHRAFRLSPRLGGPRRAADLSYPQAYPRAVAAAADEAGLDPLLLLSIARQESGFSRDVRSPRGAVGVMQLLPTTAQRLVERYEVAADPQRLDDPSVNLRLGATYLAALVRRFGGSEALAIAAYNAGPAAVVGWLEDPLRAELPLDEWVEKIPWRETRGYVKAVVSNYATYLALAGRQAPALPMALPTPQEGVDF